MNSKARIARNAFYLSLSDVGMRLISTLVTILVARYLGPEEFGVLAVALAFSGVASYFTDLGVTHVMVREGTKPGAEMGRLLSGALHLRLTMALFTTLGVVILVPLIYPSPLLWQAVLLVTLPTLWAGVFRGIGASYFWISQEMEYVALINTVAVLTQVGVLLLGVLLGWQIVSLALAYGLSACMGALVGIFLLRRRIWFSGGRYPELLQGLWAFTAAGIFALLLPQLGPLTLPRTADLEETGFFGVGYRFPGVLYTLPSVIARAFYPQLFYHGQRDLAAHRRLAEKELRVLGVLGFLLAIPFSLYAKWIIRVLFGPAWVEGGGRVLAILAWLVAFQALSTSLGDYLTTQGLQSRRTGVLGSVTVLGIGLYLLGGKWAGAVGAAWAAFTVEALLMVGCLLASPGFEEMAVRSLFPVLGVGLGATGVAFLIYRFVSSGFLGLVLSFLGSLLFVLAVDGEIREYFLWLAQTGWKKAKASFLSRA